MDMAEEVVVANGVVFAYGSGEDTTQTLPDIAWNEPSGPWVGGGLNPYSERRIPNSRHATLYALDGQTGKELWSSGNQITSWNHFERPDGRQRARLPGDVRRHDVQLRRPGGGRKVSRPMMPRHTRSIALAARSPRPASSGSGTRQPDRMADRLRRCAAHVVDPDRREHLPRDDEPAGIRAAVEDDARESAAARRLAGRRCRHVGGEHLHAALHRSPLLPTRSLRSTTTPETCSGRAVSRARSRRGRRPVPAESPGR